jgi:hypothetical protein
MVKKAKKRTRTIASTIVVGKKKRNDAFMEVRVPTPLFETLQGMNKNGEIRISENQFYDAMHGTAQCFEMKGDLTPTLNFGKAPEEAKSILTEAQELIYGDREMTYGSPDINLRSIGELWTVYLRRKRVVQGNDVISVEDVCQMMILLKTGRLINLPDHRDSLVDQAGYAGLQQRIHDECPL